MFKRPFFDTPKIPVITGAVLLLAFFSGCVFCGTSDNAASLEMSSYLTAFLNNTATPQYQSIAFEALVKLLILFAIIFISAFFRAGIILNYALVLHRGFIIGFTLSSFFKVFAVKGVLAILCMIPEQLIFLPSLLLFSSISTKLSLLKWDEKKNFLIFFIIFSIFFGTIFCASAFFNGYLTTRFMKLVASVLI